jgi:HEAT repeat protein
VASSFSDCTDPCVVLPLIRAFKDQDAKVRKQAIGHFSSYPDPLALEPLLDALRDEEASVREEAARVLHQYRDDRVTLALLEIFRNPKEDAIVRSSAGWHFVFSKEPQAFDAAMTILQERGEPSNIRAKAAQILVNLRDPRSSELMEEVAKEKGHSALRFWAAIGTVNHRNGAIDNVWIVESLRNFTLVVDGVEIYKEKKLDALWLVAKNGSTWAVRSAAINALISYSPRSLQYIFEPKHFIPIILMLVGIGILVFLRVRAIRRSLAKSTVTAVHDSQTG